MIGNLVANIVVDKFRLNPNYMMGISLLVSSMFLSRHILLSYVSEGGVYLLPLIIPLVFWQYRSHKEIVETKGYNQLRLYNNMETRTMSFMMAKHPEFYSKNYNVEYANPKYACIHYDYLPDANEKVRFNDTKFGVKGYVTFETVETSDNSSEKEKKRYHKCMVIAIEKGSKIRVQEYFESLQKYQTETRESNNEMILRYVKVLAPVKKEEKCTNHCVEIYSGKRKNDTERYQKWFGTFFSSQKKRLWTLLSNVHYHPERFHQFGQGARCNLLLHGPPGTGKSSFVHRLALSLGRHIVSVDISAFCNNRPLIYQVVQRPSILGQTLPTDEYILLLEEFDITIDFLKKKKEQLSTPIRADDGKEKSGITPLCYKTERDFEIEDLLEILQGCVPLDGSIIIATTNKYEEIKKACPALFRPGRLTPVEFGYLDWESLQELSNHYFKQKLSFGPINDIKIPSSEIIELAMESTFKGEKGFAHFSSNLQSKLRMV